MVATQCPEELRLAHTPSQWQPGNTQSHHNSQGLPHQPKSQSSIISAGFHCRGQHVVYANQNWSGDFGPCKSFQTGLQLRQHSNCTCPSFPSPAALKGDSLEIASQTSPLQDMYSVPEEKKKTSHPILRASLKDGRHCKRLQVKGTLESIKLGWAGKQNMNHSEGSHSRPNQNQPSSPTQEWEEGMKAFIEDMVAKFRRGNVGHTSSNIAANQPTAVATKAGEGNSSKYSKANAEPIPESKEEAADCATSSATSSSENNSTEYPRIMRKVAATCKKDGDETMTTAPDVPLDELAEDQLNSSLNSSPSQEENKPLQLELKKTVNGINQLPGVSRPLKGTTEEHKLDGGIQSVEGLWFGKKHGVVHFSEELQTKFVSEEKMCAPMSVIDNEDSNKDFNSDQCNIFGQDLISHSKLSSSIDKIQIHDDPSVPTSQSKQLVKRRGSEPLIDDACSVSSPPELSIAFSENEVKEQTGQLEGICEEAIAEKIVDNPEYEDISDDGQMEGMSEEAIAKKIVNNPEYEDISEDGQKEGMGEEAIALNIANSPQYEDISDDDMSRPATKLPHPHTEETSFSTPLEDLQYTFTSEDGNSKAGNVSEERLSQVTKPNNEQSLKMGVSAHVKNEISADEESNQKKPVSIETIDMEHLNSHSGFNEADDENHSVSRSSADLKNEVLDDHTDDDDDDWIVIPLTISDLRFCPGSENQEGLEIIQLDNGKADATENIFNTNLPGPKPEPTSAVSNLEVFETVDSFVQATEVQIINRFEVVHWSSPDHDIDYAEELHVPQNSREQLPEDEDSYDTEDSCDYPFDSKHNHLTVSRKLLEHSSVPPTPAADVPSSRNEGEDTVTTLKDGQSGRFNKLKEKLQQLIGKRTGLGQNISEKTDALPLELDPEGETDQSRRKKAQRKRAFRSDSKKSEDALSSQHRRNSPAIVDPEFRKKGQNNSLPSADLEAPQCQSRFSDATIKGIMQDAQLSHHTEKSGLPETKAKHKTEKPTISNNGTIIIDSDSEGESDQNCIQKAKRMRFTSSGSEDRGDPPCTDQQPPHLQSKLHDERLDKHIQNPYSDQLIQTKADSESFQPKTDRRRMLNNSTIIIDTDSEDEGVNCKKKMKRRSSSSSEVNGYIVCIDEPPPPQQNEAIHATCSKADSEPARNKTDLQTISNTESAIIVSSDSDDDSDTKEKEKRKRSITPPVSQHVSNLPDTEDVEVMQEMCSDVTCDSEDTEEEVRNKHPRERASNMKRFLPSTSEESDDTLSATKHRPASEPLNHLCVSNKKSEKDRLSSEHSRKKQLQLMDGKAETTVCGNSIIPVFLVSNVNGRDGCLEMKRKDQTRTPKNQVCKKNEQHLNTSKVPVKVAKPPLVSRQFSLPNQVGLSTSNSSLSSTSGPLTDARQSSASASGLHLSGVSRETLNPANPPRSEQSTSTPRKHLTSARLERSRSLSGPSTIDPPCSSTIAPSSSGRKKVLEIWGNNHIETHFRKRGHGKEVVRPRKDDSSREGSSGRNQSESLREARPEPSHGGLSREARPESHHDKRRAKQTHSSLVNTAPLMKKSITDYKGVPKATNREPAREQCGTVGENYKWSQKTKLKKGPSRDGMQ